MKLHEAILEGAKIRPQAYNTLFGDGKSMGYIFSRHNR